MYQIRWTNSAASVECEATWAKSGQDPTLVAKLGVRHPSPPDPSQYRFLPTTFNHKHGHRILLI